MYSRAADSRQIPVSLFAEPVVWWLVRELRWQSANGRIVYFLSLCSSVRFSTLWSFSSQKPGLCAIYLVRFPELRWWRRETCDWETDYWQYGLRWFSFQPDRTGLWVKSLQSKRLHALHFSVVSRMWCILLLSSICLYLWSFLSRNSWCALPLKPGFYMAVSWFLQGLLAENSLMWKRKGELSCKKDASDRIIAFRTPTELFQTSKTLESFSVQGALL